MIKDINIFSYSTPKKWDFYPYGNNKGKYIGYETMVSSLIILLSYSDCLKVYNTIYLELSKLYDKGNGLSYNSFIYIISKEIFLY